MRAFIKVCLVISLTAIILGCALLIIAVGNGYSIRDEQRYSFDESYDGVEAIDINIQYGDVRITEGDSFSIKTRDLFIDRDFTSQVSDGVWEITEKGIHEVNFFGLRLPVASAYGEDYLPDIYITVPEGFEAEELDISIGAGRLRSDNINARTGSFNVDAGEMIINGLTVPEGSDYSIGTGHMEISDLKAGDISIDCGIGYIEVEGTVIKDNRVKCDIGSVRMELDGDDDDYSYEIGTDIGSIHINGKSYLGKRRNRNIDGGELGSFRLDCGIGSISLDFE